jgi:hypothetical protein
MTPTEASRLKKKLHEQYMRDVAAIDRVLELSKRREGNGLMPEMEAIAPGNGGEAIQSESDAGRFGHANPAFEAEILKIISGRLVGDFKMAEVYEVVGQEKPDLAGRKSTISWAVSGLVHGGKIVKVQAGRGRRPGIYRVAETATTQN